MSALDDFDESMVVDDDIVRIALSLMIKFVFKRDLTEDQISVMNELSFHIFQNDDNTNTVCKQKTNRIFIYKRDGEKEYYEFLEGVKIPFELADLLCYIECWSVPKISRPPTILFKSDLLVRRALLINQFGFKKAPAEKIKLSKILIPFSFEKGVLKEHLDIFTAEMIASHFFFNPKVVSTVNNEMIKASRIETDKTRSAYNNAKKILVIDESQKVKMYSSDSKSEVKIDSWLNKSSYVHEIDVTSATDDSIHRIMCLIQLSEDLEYWDYRIIAFS